MSEPITCFKAYDVRGRLPDQLNEEIAYRIGRAFADYLKAKTVAVGRDVRLSSPSIQDALVRGLNAQGADAYDIGLCGTEEIYFATANRGFDGGVMVTASHNPADYNGLKFVRQEARPLTGDTGLPEIKALAEANEFFDPPASGTRKSLQVRKDYIAHLLSYLGSGRLKPLKIVVNAGNGCAGPVVDELAERLPLELIRVFNEPDGNFPNGIPNPLLPQNRAATSDRVVAEGADFGVAWDGDFDRCFLFDNRGRFIEGYYIVGLLGQAFCEKTPGAKIVYDPRMTWNTVEMVTEAGGVPIMSKAGHAFMKERMRREDALYGGEMSAHHYFKKFAYCDSGMIPWLLVAEMVSQTGVSLANMVDSRIARYPASGEINRRLDDPAGALAALESRYGASAKAVDHTDGLSVEFEDWRFNVRPSNTEPVVRLNVESRGDEALMRAKCDELLEQLAEFGAEPA